jgi:hypothetical protein
MRPCCVLLLLCDGISFLLELVWNIAAMSHASNPREVLSIDNTLDPSNTCLAAGRATHGSW